MYTKYITLLFLYSWQINKNIVLGLFFKNESVLWLIYILCWYPVAFTIVWCLEEGTNSNHRKLKTIVLRDLYCSFLDPTQG